MMSQDELYSHYVYITSNQEKRVVNKELCLRILQSHLEALKVINDYKVIQQDKDPVQVTQGLVSMPRLDHQGHAEKARKVYEDAVKWTGS